ncbi:hypothetical protein PFDG_04752 [Plasmodium falciparum Dd2]|uniref:Uncharacterized protein n=1 Tax=Plasmodium falciparum (isolate Dd2) TaxID=57267 RepID=A0A0L7M8J9_PLAF4|nr:hypothetical protein PFDG_04752 [Plasmodium falciparum Dd2]
MLQEIQALQDIQYYLQILQNIWNQIFCQFWMYQM